MIPDYIDVLNLPWRVGRKVGRTIYAVVNPAFPDDDELIGMKYGADTVLGRECTAATKRSDDGFGIRQLVDRIADLWMSLDG